MKYLLKLVFALFFINIGMPHLYAQVSPPATSGEVRIVEILQAARLEYRKIDSITELQILVGNARLKQGNTLFYCDSCVINNGTKTFEAFGNVHIKDDTTDVYSNYLRYLTDKKIAYLTGKVRLTDGKGTLTTNNLEYDVNTGIGIYRNGGKVVNKKTVLTSNEGYYYSDIKDVYFKNNVELKDPSFQLSSDSLLYNTQTETARFVSETIIKDTSSRIIITKEGFYNLQTGKAEFGQNPVIRDGAVRINANRISIDDSTGISRAEGNAVVVDTAQGTTILAGVIFRNSKTQSVLATRKPLMIIKQEADSIYIAADTLFTARLTDLYQVPDSVKSDSLKKRDSSKQLIKVSASSKDSTNRYFEAYRNVRVFSDSLQAASDSLFYSFKDSTFRLYQKPVIWANNSQITGDTIFLFTKNKKADRMEVFDNSLLVNELQPEIYNQIAATRMDGYFMDGNIDSVRAKGFAKSIYFLQEADSSYSGINESNSDILDIYFKNKELEKVIFRSAVTGTLWPIRQKNPAEMRLKNFIWLEDRRPKTKFELFE